MAKHERPKIIDCFRGEWAFLRNPWPVPIMYENVEYPSVENAYHASKTLNLKRRRVFTFADVTLSDIKEFAYQLETDGLMREDWPLLKIPNMKLFIAQKFRGSILRRKLYGTFGAQLIEGNWWHDTFWGVCYGACKQGPHAPFGDNWLGKILMDERGGPGV